MIGYPITYGDTISEDEDIKRFQSHSTSVASAVLFLVLKASSVSTIDMLGSAYEEFINANGGQF